jgi:ribosomal protein S12 methylthiotransferase accessory factor
VTDPDEPYRRLFDALGLLVDPMCGIVRSVRELRRPPGSADFFHFTARACDTSAFGLPASFGLAGGAASSRTRAAAKAIGEAVERYCSAFCDGAGEPCTSYRNAPFRCVAPEDFALYSPHQHEQPGFELVPFTQRTRVRWTPALDPLTGETWHVPSFAVYVPYRLDREAGEAPVARSTSTGLACHCSPSEAAVSALCEVVERDAFSIVWQSALVRPQILLETLSARNADLVDRFRRVGFSIRILDLTLDHGVPCVLSVARCDSGEAPALVVAASASPCPELAVRASLEELAHTCVYATMLMAIEPPVETRRPYDAITRKQQHVRFWCDPLAAPLAEALLSSSERRDFAELPSLATGEPGRDLRAMLERIREVGHRAVFADLTTPDVRSAGLWVVRAVVPGFHPLVMGHAMRALGGRRLRDVPARLGGAPRAFGDADVDLPHPYP